jgi:hypothetical protein
MVGWSIVRSTSVPRKNEGSAWCFGEHSKDYEKGKVTTTKGSWEDGAKQGIIVQHHPKVGQPYRQEHYQGQAEDFAQVIDLN